VPEAPLNFWHESEYLKIVYSELLKVRECGKIVEGVPVEPFGSEFGTIPRLHTDPELFDERKQTELVRFPEWPGPHVLPVSLAGDGVIGCEGVMKVGDGSDVP